MQPATVDECGYGSVVIPVGDSARSCLFQDCGHRPVGLSDAEYRLSGSKVFKQFSRKYGLVFRLLAKRQQQDGSAFLLLDGNRMRLVSVVPQMASRISRSVLPASLMRSICLNSTSEAHLSARTFHSVRGLPSEAKSPVWVMLK